MVDYDEIAQKATIVDWSQVIYESNFTVLGRQDLPQTGYLSLLNSFTDLYPVVESLENYQISQDNLTNVKEYRVLHYNHTANMVNLKLFYYIDGRAVVLVEEYEEISTFKPYKKTYANLAEI